MVEDHLELVKVKPTAGLSALQVVVEIPGCEPEGMELPLRSKQQDGGSLLVVDPYDIVPRHKPHLAVPLTWVVPLPLPHDVDGVRVRGEAVGVPTECCSWSG